MRTRELIEMAGVELKEEPAEWRSLPEKTHRLPPLLRFPRHWLCPEITIWAPFLEQPALSARQWVRCRVRKSSAPEARPCGGAPCTESHSSEGSADPGNPA